ncbi:MAG: glycosyltransferase [Bacteroidota bacterium]
MEASDNTKMELISVVMPVFNAAKYLRSSIESILAQTYPHFELLILDDGSTDESVAIIKSYKDQRIRLLLAPDNEGIVARLNVGIKSARGKYIARMDADDVAIVYRFEKQIKFLQAHPEIALVGSNVYLIDEQNVQQRVSTRLPLKHEAIRGRLLFKTAFFHPTTMMRTSVAKQLLYDKSFQFIEDYDLWLRMQEYVLANIAEPLLYYRFHASNTHANKQKQIKQAYPILAKRQLEYYKIAYTPEEFQIHCLLGESGRFGDFIRYLSIAKISGYLDKLINWNERESIIEQRIFKTELLDIWKEFSLAVSHRLDWKPFLTLFFHPKTRLSTNTWDKTRILYQFLSKYKSVSSLYKFIRKIMLKKRL